jgi:alkylation response protein AidB-like acyl-CoA dehydrogenase
VDFTFSEDQEALRDAVRSFLTREAPSGYVRAMLDDERGFTDGQWADLVGLGWPALLVPETHGGLGLGLVDMTVVMEEMGRLPYPGPFFSSAVLATLAARALGGDDLLSGLAGGARGAVALEEAGGGDPVARVAATASAGALDGHKVLVTDGHTADWIIVVARDEEGIAGYLVEDPAAESVPALDPTRKVARLLLDRTPARRLGPDGDQSGLWARVVDDAAVMLSAELVGTCEAALELATGYAQVRVQFERPLAKFQAIRHKAVDMLQRVELARVGTHYAAWASDADAPEREHAVAMAKSYAGEAAVFVTAEDIQIHGGVGFTWDCDAQLYYKRAKQNDVMLGAQGWRRRRLADLVLAQT